MVQVDGAAPGLLVSALGLHAAVAQLLCGVSEAVVVSVMQRAPAVGPRRPPPGRTVGRAAAWAAGQVQGAAHVGRGVPAGWGRRWWRLGATPWSIRHRVMMAVPSGFGVIV